MRILILLKIYIKLEKHKKYDIIIKNPKKELKKMPELRIREWQNTDMNTYFDLCHEKEVREYFDTLYCRNIKEVKVLFKNRKKKKFYNFLIEVNQNVVGVVVGNAQKNSIEVSYFIGKEFRRKGYCVKAIALLKEAFKDTQYKSLHFKISKYNANSLKVMEKIGATNCKEDKDWIYFNLPIE